MNNTSSNLKKVILKFCRHLRHQANEDISKNDISDIGAHLNKKLTSADQSRHF